ncbi:conjugal transfer protein [Listeria booriae]|uniref:Conjugal transfer protein n=1 Tax=Listeria booriae TaxID=1552123 RepID=A0A7X0WGV4_9LIST|nr:TcpE family conjugal transfer membrane protein [Listeria booriae]MBC1333537.1 conjugal transfer protein [Listeria booriae]MBC1618035.1 conjugal transfer protein [Listeria booriae]MDT0112138.1 TcpE family conjugal transfer membrane protein [Listeria booriae]
MEYDYTKILKQPIRLYTIKGIPIPFFKNGISMQQIIVIAIVFAVAVLFGIFAFTQKLEAAIHFIMNWWVLILGAIFVILWTLFSLSWDRKNIFRYVLDRLLYEKKKAVQYEHGEHVEVPLGQRVTYDYKED